MAFGKKKKEPISHKLTQTQKITCEGILDVREDGSIFIDIEDMGPIHLAVVFKEMDGRIVSLSLTNQRTDTLELDLNSDHE